MKKKDRKYSDIKKITVTGFIINLFLGSLKIFTGIIGNSHSAVADGIHSFSDLSTDIAILIGVKFWSAPPDQDHPYGHGRIETLITLFIGMVLIFAGGTIAYSSIVSVRVEDISGPDPVAVTGILLTIILKEILFRWTLNTGKKHGSSAIIANAWHHRSDAFSSLIALISISVSIFFPGLEFIDRIGALAVSFIILKASWDIIKPSLSELCDRGLNNEKIEKIKDISLRVAGVREVHAVRGRSYGGGYYIDLHILVNDKISVKEGHDIAEEVKKSLLAEDLSVIDVIIHIEPYEFETLS